MIREAQQCKEDALLTYGLLMEMHKEVNLPIGNVVPEKVMFRFLHTVTRGKLFMAHEAEDVYGILGVIPEVPWWNNDEFLVDTFFFVRADKRAGGTAPKLLKAAKEYAIISKLPLHIGLLTGKDLGRKERFMERQGFVKIGATYRMEV